MQCCMQDYCNAALMQILHGDAYAGSPERMIGGVSNNPVDL